MINKKLLEKVSLGLVAIITTIAMSYSTSFYFKEKSEKDKVATSFTNYVRDFSLSISELSEIFVPVTAIIFNSQGHTVRKDIAKVFTTSASYTVSNVNIETHNSVTGERLSLAIAGDRLEIYELNSANLTSARYNIIFDDYYTVLTELSTLPYNFGTIQLNKDKGTGYFVVNFLPEGVYILND